MVIGCCVSGFGMAIQVSKQKHEIFWVLNVSVLQGAQANGLISSFNDAPTKLWFLHGGCGLLHTKLSVSHYFV